MMTTFIEATSDLPLVAILRGITPGEIDEVGHVLIGAGFRLIEIPLTSPDAFASIARLVARAPETILVGAGTVRTLAQVDQLVDCGGTLIVTPHADLKLIKRAKERGLFALPGAATPTEAFSAFDAGADGVKLFPAEAIPPYAVKAWHTVTGDHLLFPTGGITPELMADYVDAGALGFGLGSALYRPGASAEDVGRNAALFVGAWRKAVDTLQH